MPGICLFSSKQCPPVINHGYANHPLWVNYPTNALSWAGCGVAGLHWCGRHIKLRGGRGHYRWIIPMPSNGVLPTMAPQHHRICNLRCKPGRKTHILDLKLARLVPLWLMIEHVCTMLREKKVAIFSFNSLTVSWVQQMACRAALLQSNSYVSSLYVSMPDRAVNLQPFTLRVMKTVWQISPCNLLAGNKKWHFKTDTDLLTFFNLNFLLPSQNSWTVSQPTSTIATRVISTLGITHFTLDKWRRLPIVTQNIWIIGKPIQGLWEWTLIFRTQSSQCACRSFLDSWQGSTRDTLVKENRSNIAQSAVQLQLLARWLHWSATTSLQK